MHPFSDNPDETVASVGEKRLLQEVRKWLGQSAPLAPQGMGDDCAEIPDTQDPTRLITTDSVVYRRHFDDTAPPRKVGEKLLKRNLSDIAAMGGTPTQAVIAGFLPRTTRLDWLEACLRGIAGCALDNGVRIVGGDLAETESELALNLTLLGTGGSLLYRTGGKSGDWICVTGPLGGSREGRHLDFVPRLREGRLLAGQDGIHACIDISDGLVIDLLNILPDDCSAALDPDAVPIHPDAEKSATQSGKPPLWHALNDGEDHELLFLASPMSQSDWTAFITSFTALGLAAPIRIGKLVTRGDQPVLNAITGQPLEDLQGYDHFR